MSTQSPVELASYSSLFFRLLDSAFLIDQETFAILDLNDSCERTLDTPTEQLRGKVLSEFVIEEMKEEFCKKLRMARRRYHPVEFDCRWKTAHGKLIAMRIGACKLTLQNNEEVIQVIAKDVTKEKETQEKLAVYTKELESLNTQLEELSITDELTGLFNVRRFKETLSNEHDRTRRYKGSYAIVFFDVDNFKHYNDRNGHPAGDSLLRTLAQLFKSNCRDTDFLARYGGEEFVILCPQVSWEGAMVVAERFRTLVDSYPFRHAEAQPLGRVSVSVGVASYPENGETFQEVLKAADDALYASKKSGRNRVTAHSQVSDKNTEKKAA